MCQNAVKEDLQIWSSLVPAPVRACRYHPPCGRGPGTAMCKKGENQEYLLDWVAYDRLVSRDIPPTEAKQKVLLLRAQDTHQTCGQLLGKQLVTELQNHF